MRLTKVSPLTLNGCWGLIQIIQVSARVDSEEREDDVSADGGIHLANSQCRPEHAIANDFFCEFKKI